MKFLNLNAQSGAFLFALSALAPAQAKEAAPWHLGRCEKVLTRAHTVGDAEISSPRSESRTRRIGIDQDRIVVWRRTNGPLRGYKIVLQTDTDPQLGAQDFQILSTAPVIPGSPSGSSYFGAVSYFTGNILIGVATPHLVAYQFHMSPEDLGSTKIRGHCFATYRDSLMPLAASQLFILTAHALVAVDLDRSLVSVDSLTLPQRQQHSIALEPNVAIALRGGWDNLFVSKDSTPSQVILEARDTAGNIVARWNYFEGRLTQY